MFSVQPSLNDLNLQQIALRTAVVIWFAVIIGVLLPGLSSYWCNVFFDQQVRKKLPDYAAEKLNVYEAHKKELQSRINRIDNLLGQNQSELARTGEGVRLTKMRDYYKKELESQKPPVIAEGYYLNGIMPLWPSMFFSLGFLVYVLPPRTSTDKKAFSKFAVPAFLLFWPLHRSWTWLRNFVFYQAGRVVYADANYDISPVAFVIQELMAGFVCFLLIVVWYQWIKLFTERCTEIREVKNDEFAAFDPNIVSRLSTAFLHWQIASVILSFGFIWYTIFFWNAVSRSADYRYLPHAIIVHLVWAFTWAIISSPLIITWHHWYVLRAKVANQLAGSLTIDKDRAKVVAELMDKVQPIGIWNVVASGIAAVTSFFFPILQSLVH